MDVHSKKQRSFNMSQIKARNTRPELVISQLLKDLKISFRTHVKNLPGKPDFFISELNLVIEVYGCFWHGHKKCRFFILPSSNRKFWKHKIDSNIKRDLKNQKAIFNQFNLLTIWECEIKDGSYLIKIVNKIDKIGRKASLKNS